MTTWKVGDVVRLKSGSPKMTIVGIPKEKEADKSPPRDEYYAAYFKGDSPATVTFPADALERDAEKKGTPESRAKARTTCTMLRERGHTAETSVMLRAQEAGDFDEPDGSVVWKPEGAR